MRLSRHAATRDPANAIEFDRVSRRFTIQHERTEVVGRAIAVRTDDWCYIERLYEGPELYDRRADRHETVNLAGRPEHSAI